ncbi:hypothetical protein GOV08_04115, partial [Candidatus Woesearchaeota archaeon]|nr:hypothetical protein [Candidatus Woesearchaeota archaeon]
MNKRSIVIFLVFFLALAPVFASQLITYQGRIGQNGQALSSGNITVYLYDQAAGGSLVWSDTFTDSIINGYFDVVLGSGNALNIIYGRRYFLDMDVNGQDINWSGSDRVELEAGVGTISNVSINTSEIQQRVTSACGAGWYLRQINEDGSVVCEEASQGASASSGWNKSGTDVYLYNTGDSVGIGTTSPGAKLEVNGTIRTNITSCSQALETDGSGNMVCGVDDDTTYTENDKYLTLTGTIFGLDESVLNTTIDNKITASDNGWSSDGTTTNTSLNVDIGSGSLFVNSISGLVGIGNTGPDTKLHITGGLCIDTDTVCTDPGPGNANVTGWLDANQLCIASDCKASWAAAANDTNAKTLCLDGEYLRGEAATTCRTAAGIVSDGGGSTFGASVDDTEMTAEDFGDWTCTGLEDGCTIDSTTSANWANKVSDETGSTGNWVFSAGPAFTGETSVTGTSTSWGTVPTAGWKTTMGTSTSATWLAYGESSNTFRGGLQLLDSGGSMRIYVGSGYISISSAGDLTVAGGDITFGTTPISEADIGIINDGVIALTTETSGNYVANVSGGTAITVTGADGEGATKTVAVTNDAIGDTQLAFNTGQHLNITSNVDFNQMDVTDYITASGGIHIGGISDPGTDNLIVDGNVGIGISNPTEKLTLGGGNFLQTAGTPKHAGNLSDGVGGAQLNSPWDVFVAGKYAYITAYG